MRYFGGENLAGGYQRIINQIPPHRLYVEPFAGSAAILRHKRPAERSIAIDLDPGALDAIRETVPPGAELINGDGIAWLKRLLGQQKRKRLPEMASRIFIYCDPPYLLETRSSGPRYRHELNRGDHGELIGILASLNCRVMLSGYRSELYDRGLRYWRRIEFKVITRGGGSARECLWMNYPEPIELHDHRFLGRDFREREKLVRQQRWRVARLARMDRLQRQALLAALATVPIADGEKRTPPGPRGKSSGEEVPGSYLGTGPDATGRSPAAGIAAGGGTVRTGRKGGARGNRRKG